MAPGPPRHTGRRPRPTRLADQPRHRSGHRPRRRITRRRRRFDRPPMDRRRRHMVAGNPLGNAPPFGGPNDPDPTTNRRTPTRLTLTIDVDLTSIFPYREYLIFGCCG